MDQVFCITRLIIILELLGGATSPINQSLCSSVLSDTEIQLALNNYTVNVLLVISPWVCIYIETKFAYWEFVVPMLGYIHPGCCENALTTLIPYCYWMRTWIFLWPSQCPEYGTFEYPIVARSSGRWIKPESLTTRNCPINHIPGLVTGPSNE